MTSTFVLISLILGNGRQELQFSLTSLLLLVLTKNSRSWQTELQNTAESKISNWKQVCSLPPGGKALTPVLKKLSPLPSRIFDTWLESTLILTREIVWAHLWGRPNVGESNHIQEEGTGSLAYHSRCEDILVNVGPEDAGLRITAQSPEL